MDKMLSVVLPAYNEEQMIKKTSQVVRDLLEKEQIPRKKEHISKESAFPEILEKKEPFLQESHRQKETVLQ